MQGHISQVAAQTSAGDSGLLCVVQATSPARRPGLLRDMHALMSSDTNIQVAFTGERLKICGILDGSLFGQDESQPPGTGMAIMTGRFSCCAMIL